MNIPYEDPQAQRPEDTFTAKDGARLFGLIDSLSKRVENELKTVREQVTAIYETIIKIQEAQSRIENGLAETRVDRLELELQEAKLELERAEVTKKTVEEKIQLKQDVKDKSIDTKDRVPALVAESIDARERREQEEKRKKIEDLKWTMIKSAATWGTVGAIGLLVSFVWFLIRLYMDRGGP
jgi:uncharacterized protein YPO0396